MSTPKEAKNIEWIPIDRVVVINPRERNPRSFKEITDNIAKIGLKRPITVTRRKEQEGDWFDLVCGQGRLEAYKLLKQDVVPAMVVVADAEDCLIASLVENCARRQPDVIEQLEEINAMQKRGQSNAEIARKIGLSEFYVHEVCTLLNKGEHRLLKAVEARTLPLSVAIQIASADDQGAQRALHEAYEKGVLKGKKLFAVKRLLELRKLKGKKGAVYPGPVGHRITTAQLVKTYEADVTRKSDLIARSRAVQNQLLLIIEALRRLCRDERFVSLLEDENLATLPASVSSRIDIAEPVG